MPNPPVTVGSWAKPLACGLEFRGIKGDVYNFFRKMPKRKSAPDDEREQELLQLIPEVYKKQRLTPREKRKFEVFGDDLRPTKKAKHNNKSVSTSAQTDPVDRDPFVVLKSNFLKARGIKNVTIYFI